MHFIQLWTADWTKDTRQLTPDQKGVWIDMLCILSEQKENRGVLTRTLPQWALIVGTSVEHVTAVIAALESLKICNVSRPCHGEVTIMSRRIVRDAEKMEGDRKRKSKSRAARKTPPVVTHGHAPVTELSRTDTRSSEAQKQETRAAAAAAGEAAAAVLEGDAAHQILVAEFPTLSWEDDLRARQHGPGIDYAAAALECVVAGSNERDGVDNAYRHWRGFVKAAAARSGEAEKKESGGGENGPLGRWKRKTVVE